MLQLTFQDGLTLTAYGLIATQMPDGSRGYSLLIFITAEGFQPIPLGLGFVLESIGGILAVNRTFDQDALKAGLRTDSLAALLFPSDPVVNAPAIIRALSVAFPARRDSYLLGLVARITWFRPILVQLDLALILELGSRNRLLALGRATALLPTADNDLIRLKLDAVGVVDFESGDVAFDALLVDSPAGAPVSDHRFRRAARELGDRWRLAWPGELRPRRPVVSTPALRYHRASRPSSGWRSRSARAATRG